MWAASLLHGPLAAALLVCGPLALMALATGALRGWWSPWRGPAAAVAVTLALAGGLRVSGLVPWRYPASFLAWCALPIACLCCGVHAVVRRAPAHAIAHAGVVAVAGAGFAADQVDRHYAYLPTLGDVLGRPLPDAAPVSRLQRSVHVIAPDGAPQSASPIASEPSVHGALVEVRLPAPTSRLSRRPELLWVPPAWSPDGPPRSVLVLLPGTPGTPGDWARGGRGIEALDAWAARDPAGVPVAVMADPNGSAFADTECVDQPGARAETYLVRDLPRAVEAQLHVATDPARWAVAGLSEGGTCAVDLAVRHPDVFGGPVIDLSGDLRPNVGPLAYTLQHLWHGDAAAMAAHDDPVLLAAPSPTLGRRIFLSACEGDQRGLHASQVLAAAATAGGWDVHQDHLDGGHDYACWGPAFTRAVSWLALTTSGAALATPATRSDWRRALGMLLPM